MAASAAILGGGALLAYFVIGIAMGRSILTRVRWFKYRATVADIAHVKVWALFLWPIVYPIFLVKLFINRYL